MGAIRREEHSENSISDHRSKIRRTTALMGSSMIRVSIPSFSRKRRFSHSRKEIRSAGSVTRVHCSPMSLPSTVSAALHSLTGKRWVLPSSLRKGSVVEILAKARSIDLHAEVSWESLSDPLTLGEMKRAVERTRFALQKSKSGRPWPRENIGIIGDYDADGITGAAQLLRFFRRKGL